jgi:hypothetical protein
MRTANNGPSFLPANRRKPPRLGSLDWVNSGPDKPAIFNAAYDIDGAPLDVGEDPWTLIDLDGDWRHFHTHAEAISYATTNAPAKSKEAA